MCTSPLQAHLRHHWAPQTLNQVPFGHLWDFCNSKATALIPHPLLHNNPDSVSVCVWRWREGWGWGARGMLNVKGCYPCAVMSGQAADITVIIQTWNHNRTHRPHKQWHTQTHWCSTVRGTKMGQIAGWELYQGQMGQGRAYTCSKSHRLSADKSLRCLTWIVPLFSITRTSHTVIMNRSKWVLNTKVFVTNVSPISEI